MRITRSGPLCPAGMCVGLQGIPLRPRIMPLCQGWLAGLEFAVAAASRPVTRHGPRGGKASRAEVLDWLKDRTAPPS